MKFFKYHGLGNDYIVLNPEDLNTTLAPEQITRICHRNFGIGSDGILLGPLADKDHGTDFALKIYNTDGSEAEKSGNGLRIFSRYLWDKGLVDSKPFTIHTLGGIVTSQILNGGKEISVGMGHVSFQSKDVPVVGPNREVIDENIVIDGVSYTYCAATIGNPHCVIVKDEISKEEACKYGPNIEIDSLFPNRTNVQFMRILDRNNIQIEIWERGVGYTLASGSSASASAAVAFKLGHIDSHVTVHMPGGNMEIEIAEDFSIQMTGAVTRVCEGLIDPEIFDIERA
ncbi:MAG TPA: diaminopimelate epimerase [Deltaproteobacteria bacterium]|nr:diaminopimelate epimerase [Deltaproteobacteria bacterium]